MPVWLKKKWHLDLDQMWGEFKLSTSQKEKSFPVAQKLKIENLKKITSFPTVIEQSHNFNFTL